MKVIRARTAGFCMGVSLALRKLETALAEFDGRGRICTLGPIIHNPRVMAHFGQKGVRCLDSIGEAAKTDHVLIRAHGVPRQIEDALKARCSRVEDATCPKVKKAQLAIARSTAAGAGLLLFGEADHPEVAGLISYAAGGAFVFSSLEEAERLSPDPARAWVLASQTTQDREIFAEVAAMLESRLPRLTILRTICDATRQRQAEALAIAGEVDAMVIIGGRQSGNTRRLASLARQAGKAAWHVEAACELEAGDFAGKTSVGLTAGASTPKSDIDEAEKWLLNLEGK